MSSLLALQVPAPSSGATLDTNPRTGGTTGALQLQNIRVDAGFARSRLGYAALNGAAAFESPGKRVIDIFDRQFADGTGEAIRCTRDTTQRSAAGAWAAITLDSAWTGADTNRFWCVIAPWAAETKGRIMLGNGVNVLKTWTGGAGTLTAYAGGFISRFGIVGDDNRLFIGYTTEAGSIFSQRVRWTVIALANGGATDWTATGSGVLELRNDQWPITGFWKQGGRIYVGKSRGICVLVPTGIATNAYGYETLQTNGEGLFARGSLIQFGNTVAFVTHRGISVFDGATLTPILGPNRLTFQARLNKQALDQITVAYDTRTNRVGWGLPLDGSGTPTEIWWYELDTGHWEMDTIPHTALSLYTAVNTVTIDSLGGLIQDLTGTIDSLSGSGVNEPLLVFGTAAGKTFQFDMTSRTDAGALIQAAYVSPGIVPIGQTIRIAGRDHTINETDYLIVDAVTLRLLDRGYEYSVKIEVSGNGGVTWTNLGNAVIKTAGGTDLKPRLVRQFRSCRCPVKDTVQIRLSSSTLGACWGWSDTTVFVDVLGEKRIENVGPSEPAF